MSNAHAVSYPHKHKIVLDESDLAPGQDVCAPHHESEAAHNIPLTFAAKTTLLTWIGVDIFRREMQCVQNLRHNRQHCKSKRHIEVTSELKAPYRKLSTWQYDVIGSTKPMHSYVLLVSGTPRNANIAGSSTLRPASHMLMRHEVIDGLATNVNDQCLNSVSEWYHHL